MRRPRRPRRRGTPATLTADQWLTALRRVVDGATINHEHVIRHEPPPPIVAGEVVIKRMDGSEGWHGRITPGRGMLTMLHVPLSCIDPKLPPSKSLTFEFRWER